MKRESIEGKYTALEGVRETNERTQGRNGGQARRGTIHFPETWGEVET
jgi:hypothetical protein